MKWVIVFIWGLFSLMVFGYFITQAQKYTDRYVIYESITNLKCAMFYWASALVFAVAYYHTTKK